MRQTVLLLISILLITICACKEEITGIRVRTILSKESATDIVHEYYLAIDSTIAIYVMSQKLAKNTEVQVDGHTENTPKAEFESWFFCIDLDYPLTQIPRSFRYVFVDINSGVMITFEQGHPPVQFSDLELVYPVRQSTQPLTRMEAFHELQYQYLGQNSKYLVLAGQDIVTQLDTIHVSGEEKSYTVSGESWFFFIDRNYIISDIWPRSCSYVFVNATTGFIEVHSDNRPPEILANLDTVYHEWKLQNFTTPVLSFSDSSLQFGCGNIRVYAENIDQNAIVVIEADETQLGLGTDLTEFDLAQIISGLEVTIDFYNYLPPHYTSMTYRYCTDIGWYVRLPQKWTANAGSIKIAVSADDHAQIILENVIFIDASNQYQVILENLNLADILVRWLPG